MKHKQICRSCEWLSCLSEGLLSVFLGKWAMAYYTNYVFNPFKTSFCYAFRRCNLLLFLQLLNISGGKAKDEINKFREFFKEFCSKIFIFSLPLSFETDNIVLIFFVIFYYAVIIRIF